MEAEGRPGPKPRRLYARFVWFEGIEGPESRRAMRRFVDSLDRVGRLVAHGPLTSPATGDLVVFRARDLAEAERTLRADPLHDLPGSSYSLVVWNPTIVGGGINLDPAPPIGSGRLTQLHRISVVVRDRTSAINWYQDVLGFQVRAEDADTGYVELALGRGAVALTLVAPRPEWGTAHLKEAFDRLGRQTGIVFQTDSVEALALRLEHARATVTQPPERQPWGGRTLRFTDPDGNEFLAFDVGRSKARSAPPPAPMARPPRAPKAS